MTHYLYGEKQFELFGISSEITEARKQWHILKEKNCCLESHTQQKYLLGMKGKLRHSQIKGN